MVRSLGAVSRACQAALLALAGYHAVVALWGWPTPVPAPPGPRRRPFRIFVPAHDEAAVIAGLLDDLSAQDYPRELVRVEVLADRCTDATAEVARAGGAAVVERREGRPGKGPTLAWRLEEAPLAPDEALVVLDADNRVPPSMLARFDDELTAAADALQAYLDVANPEGSALATASALTYWAGNRMVQLARRNLGWSADLGGTGMCLTPAALAAVGGFGASLTEDAELALRLVQPGRSFLALVTGVLAVTAATTRSRALLHWPIWAAAAGVQTLQPLPFLARDGLPARYLVRYPLVTLIALLWLPVRLAGRLRAGGWYHTPHGR
jgi:cellulose synthase/poly-beta-1,6-N-acetylglucosamine synthase-like glycosyltransferase